MPHMSLQSLNVFGHGVEVFSIILLPRGLHSHKSGTGCMEHTSFGDTQEHRPHILAIMEVSVN